jgi:hypothetical protein
MFDWLFKRSAKVAPAAARFPFPIETVNGSEALATFERLKRGGEGLPVILGGDKALEQIVDIMAFARDKGETVESILRQAERNRFPEGLRAAHAEQWRLLKERHPDWAEDEEESEADSDWPETPPEAWAGPAVAFELGIQTPLKRVHIALIPTHDATAIPAYLQWGNWNACPAPHHHVAAARAWRERYGAELVSMAADVVEIRVTRRPKDRAEALALAQQHCEYCSEIEDLTAHAASLMASDWWYFWWD